MNLGSAIGGLDVYENVMHPDMLSHNNLINPLVELDLSELIKLSPRTNSYLEEKVLDARHVWCRQTASSILIWPD